MPNKRKIIIMVGVGAAVVLLAIGSWFYFQQQTGSPPVSNMELERLKSSRPELVEFIDDITSWQSKVETEPDKVQNYFGLGLAWKSLADRTRDSIHYRAALRVYEQGIEKTERKNTIFLTNAANMAVYLNDFSLAERYLREGIAIAPGDADLYVRLAELYEYRMNKSKEEIAAVFDEGLTRTVTGKAQLEQSKREYLRRVEAK